eukprot:COSAG02_NODE_979_length_15497_cov_5.029549_7_plen_1218_part_00
MTQRNFFVIEEEDGGECYSNAVSPEHGVDLEQLDAPRSCARELREHCMAALGRDGERPVELRRRADDRLDLEDRMPLVRAVPESLPAIPFVEESARSPSLRQCAHGCPRVCAGMMLSYLLYGGLFVAVLLWTGVSCFGADGRIHTELPSFSRGSRMARPLARFIADVRTDHEVDTCSDTDSIARLHASCNTCRAAVYDGDCDEGSRCEFGTDGHDCLVHRQRELAIEVLHYFPPEIHTPKFVLGVIIAMAFGLTALGLMAFRARRFPVVLDQVFDIIRSRTLAVVECVTVFVLLISLFIDWAVGARSCAATFELHPVTTVTHSAEEVSFFADSILGSLLPDLWPDSYVLPRITVSFREDEVVELAMVVGFFIIRFVLANLANSQWQDLGSSCTGWALSLAMIFSVSSLFMTSQDAMSCPAFTSVMGGGTLDCTIFDDALLDGMPFQDFKGNCDVQRQTGWNESFVSFRQTYKHFDAGSNYAILQSRLDAFDSQARAYAFQQAATHESRIRVFPSLPVPQSDQAGTDSGVFEPSRPCNFAAGSVLEAVHAYGNECAYNHNKAISASVVWTLLALNCVELLMLIKITLPYVWQIWWGCRGAAGDRSNAVLELGREAALAFDGPGNMLLPGDFLATSAEKSRRKGTANFPVRLLVGVYTGAVLVVMLLVSTWMLAHQLERTVNGTERAIYNETVVNFMRAKQEHLAMVTESEVWTYMQHYMWDDDLMAVLQQQLVAALNRTASSNESAWHNTFFETDDCYLPPRRHYPPFNTVDQKCPCEIFTQNLAILHEVQRHAEELVGAFLVTSLEEPVSGVSEEDVIAAFLTGETPTKLKPVVDRFGRGTTAAAGAAVSGHGNSGAAKNMSSQELELLRSLERQADGVGSLLVNLTFDNNLCGGIDNAEWNAQQRGCVCRPGYAVNDAGTTCMRHRITTSADKLFQMVEEPTTGQLIKCNFEWLRQVYEPLPFCLRAAATISACIGALSAGLFLKKFRREQARIHHLVEIHFDVATGWPADCSTVLAQDDVLLLTGGRRSWSLDYGNLDTVSRFVGLYTGNMLTAFVVNTAVWFVLLYWNTCRAIPSHFAQLMWLSMPVAVEQSIKLVVWRKIIDQKRGLRHPRIYSAVDSVLSIIAVVTGPIKTAVRLSAAAVCLFLSLYRTDLMIMVDSYAAPLDMHFNATGGLHAALRVRLEFEKLANADGTRAVAEIGTVSPPVTPPKPHVK